MASIDTSNQSLNSILTAVTTTFTNGSSNYTSDRVQGLVAYMQNPVNASGIITATQLYGNPQNKSYNDQLNFYYAAYYYNLYPATTTTDSATIASMQTSVQNELSAASLDTDTDKRNARTLVLKNIQSQLATAASTSSTSFLGINTSNLTTYAIWGVGIYAVLKLLKTFTPVPVPLPI